MALCKVAATTAEQIAEQIKLLDAKITAHPHWGAYLSVLDTERKGWQARLAAMQAK